jgi:predicted phosphodiesterase
MKIAVLSDIHANYPALQAVWQHAKDRAERFWFLGDVAGYGPNPVECLDWLCANVNDEEWVLGNHDAMLLALSLRERWKEDWEGDIDSQNKAKERNGFAFRELAAVENPERRYLSEEEKKQIAIGGAANSKRPHRVIAALRLNLEAIAKSNEAKTFWQRTFTESWSLPKMFPSEGVDYWLVHASRLPGEQMDPYIYPWSIVPPYLPPAQNLLPPEIAELRAVFARTNRPLCQWHGHTHVAYLVALDDPQDAIQPLSVKINTPYKLGKAITLVNPGSVGQPRNGDDRACYAVLDTDERVITFHRVTYPKKKTLRQLSAEGYPNEVEVLLNDSPYVKDGGETWEKNFKEQKEDGRPD